jgi:glucose/arabinose dehydrogenase
VFNKADDKLYITVGDADKGSKTAQNLSSLNGKVLRINRDGTIPKDNPFPNSPVYTYGHRNMYGLAFDDSGHGIVTENGGNVYDEINYLLKGGNYGYSTLQHEDTVPNPYSNDSSIKPLRSYFSVIAPTQAIYYTGDKYPELKNRFIFGSFSGNLYAYKLSQDGKKLLEELKIRTFDYPLQEVVATTVSPNGDIYFGSYNIYKLNKLDLSSKVHMMFPVLINATNIHLSDINYLRNTGHLTLDLSDINGSSDIDVRMPKSPNENMD